MPQKLSYMHMHEHQCQFFLQIVSLLYLLLYLRTLQRCPSFFKNVYKWWNFVHPCLATAILVHCLWHCHLHVYVEIVSTSVSSCIIYNYYIFSYSETMHLYLGSLKYAAKECILLQASVICSKINRCREQDSTLHLLILKLNQAPEYGSSFQIFAKLSVEIGRASCREKL